VLLSLCKPKQQLVRNYYAFVSKGLNISVCLFLLMMR